jgi:hypothetical protein
MSVRRTPQLYASGKFVLTAPFIANPQVNYVCNAIRSFDDIYELNEDVFERYYAPLGLTTTRFNEDRAAKVCIVTLIAENSEIIYVPDSFIESFPDLSGTKYSRIVISLDLQALPDAINLQFVIQRIKDATQETIGIIPDLRVHKSPTKGFTSASDHASAEAARVANITALKSDYQLVKELQTIVARQQVEIQTLVQLARDNDLIEVT